MIIIRHGYQLLLTSQLWRTWFGQTAPGRPAPGAWVAPSVPLAVAGAAWGVHRRVAERHGPGLGLRGAGGPGVQPLLPAEEPIPGPRIAGSEVSSFCGASRSSFRGAVFSFGVFEPRGFVAFFFPREIQTDWGWQVASLSCLGVPSHPFQLWVLVFRWSSRFRVSPGFAGCLTNPFEHGGFLGVWFKLGVQTILNGFVGGGVPRSGMVGVIMLVLCLGAESETGGWFPFRGTCDFDSGRILLSCYWVGSLDFNFLVEIKLGFPPNPPKS